MSAVIFLFGIICVCTLWLASRSSRRISSNTATASGGERMPCGSIPQRMSSEWSRNSDSVSALPMRGPIYLPRNVQKDEEASRAWVLKDEVIARGRVYYAKLLKGKSWFVAPRLIPAFNAIWGVPRAREERDLSGSANKILKVLRTEWEMASADLRAEAGITTRPRFNKALDKLQLTMKVVPQEVVYIPRFTYIWTLAEARFPKQLKIKMPRDKAVRELARAYLTMCGMTLLGDTARTFGLTRREAGRANHELVDEGFAERIATGIYRLKQN